MLDTLTVRAAAAIAPSLPQQQTPSLPQQQQQLTLSLSQQQQQTPSQPPQVVGSPSPASPITVPQDPILQAELDRLRAVLDEGDLAAIEEVQIQDLLVGGVGARVDVVGECLLTAALSRTN